MMLLFLKMAPLIAEKIRKNLKPTRLIPIAEHDLRTIGFIVVVVVVVAC
jgi:hypothetical protein